jgi:hypothetical protein
VLIYQDSRRLGFWKINTAQALIFLIAVGCAITIVNAYVQAHHPPQADSLQTASDRGPQFARYAAEIDQWHDTLGAQQITLTWPYQGQDFVARIDLPSKVPITLSDWDPESEAREAQKAYIGFVQARKKARVPHPDICIVHVFDSTGVEVAQASSAGVSSSANGP